MNILSSLAAVGAALVVRRFDARRSLRQSDARRPASPSPTPESTRAAATAVDSTAAGSSGDHEAQTTAPAPESELEAPPALEAAAPVDLRSTLGWRLTHHAKRRAAERGVSIKEVLTVVAQCQDQSPGRAGRTVLRWKDVVAVVDRQSRIVITTYRVPKTSLA